MNEQQIPLIPYPFQIKSKLGKFIINSDTSIQLTSNSEMIGNYLRELLSPVTGFKFPFKEKTERCSNCIILEINEDLKKLNEEGYKLSIETRTISISAPRLVGIFYGAQTLRQLLPVEIESKILIKDKEWYVPCLEIIDYPRFSYRGFMLDEGRHFQGKVIVKRIIELMALHKLNMFHWHLTEDQGWRIQIDKYPLLTKIGSKRTETQIGGYRSFRVKKTDGKPHSGFYIKDDILEIINYAKDHFITIIPEIDMPGHIMSALAAYPELGCTGGPYEVQTTFGIKKDVLCLGKERVYDFIKDILNEVMDLFPNNIIHIGGDEVPKDRWKECPDCQNMIEKEKLCDEEELETYFTNTITNYIISRSKIPMGWNEIINDKLNRDVIIQHWLRRDKDVIQELRKGRKAIISRFFYTYLDYPYFMTPLEKVYNFEPVPKGLEKKFYQNVLGIEAPLWTEWVHNQDRLDWQMFPRLTAIAEIGWTTQENKNYDSFQKRLKHFYKRMDYLGVKYEHLEKANPNPLKRLFTPLLMFKDPRNYVRKM